MPRKTSEKYQETKCFGLRLSSRSGFIETRSVNFANGVGHLFSLTAVVNKVIIANNR
jgi:hypothetical protein